MESLYVAIQNQKTNKQKKQQKKIVKKHFLTQINYKMFMREFLLIGIVTQLKNNSF